MKFFTDKTVKNSYLLIKLQDYFSIQDFTPWKEVLIDPGVYELIKSNKYSWEGTFNLNSFLDSLPDNHYFSGDYPCDMNELYTTEFLIKSWLNALKYSSHPNYIVTVQFKFKDRWNFVKWFDWYNNLEIQSRILGLGNLCRIHYLTPFMKNSLNYAFKNCNHQRIHIYGLALRIIPYAYKLAKKYNIKLSFDSTKWTRACTVELKREHGYNSMSGNRQLFFDTYKKIIEERIR